jgi:hypothetical protein
MYLPLSSLFLRLAERTEMRTALAYDDSLNGCRTLGTRFSGPLVNPELILEVATAVDPIDAGAIMLQSGQQGFPDALPEIMDLLGHKLIAACHWVNAGKMQRFICVNIAQTCYKALIH